MRTLMMPLLAAVLILLAIPAARSQAAPPAAAVEAEKRARAEAEMRTRAEAEAATPPPPPAEAAPAAADVRLANESKLFAADVAKNLLLGPRRMQLDPTGKRLVFLRKEKAKDTGRTLYRYVVYNLAAKKETLPDIPAFDDDDIPEAAMIIGALFDARGERLLLAAGVDADKNGRHEQGSEPMETVVVDLATGKVARVGRDIRKMITVPAGFAGDRVFFTSGDRDKASSRALCADLRKGGEPTVVGAGVAIAPDPTGKQMPLVEFVRGGPHGMQLTLVSLDKEDRTGLPSFSENVLKVGLAWSADGRYLYYADRDPDSRETVTRIWQVREKAMLGMLKNAAPVGAGPLPGSMVLASGKGRKPAEGACVFVPTTGKVVVLEGVKAAVCANGGKLLYTRDNAGGEAEIYIANIVAPGAEKKAEPVRVEMEPAK